MIKPLLEKICMFCKYYDFKFREEGDTWAYCKHKKGWFSKTIKTQIGLRSCEDWVPNNLNDNEV